MDQDLERNHQESRTCCQNIKAFIEDYKKGLPFLSLISAMSVGLGFGLNADLMKRLEVKKENNEETKLNEITIPGIDGQLFI